MPPADGALGRRAVHQRHGRERHRDSHQWDKLPQKVPPDDLPSDVIEYMLSSRYCEVDELSAAAWRLFENYAPGWNRVQQICNYVYARIRFDYQFARNTRITARAMNERVGVCRDFTHLAIALCRAMNILARYCNGFLGDIGVRPDPAPMDYNAWFERYLAGKWYIWMVLETCNFVGVSVIPSLFGFSGIGHGSAGFLRD